LARLFFRKDSGAATIPFIWQGIRTVELGQFHALFLNLTPARPNAGGLPHQEEKCDHSQHGDEGEIA
jgi:hypothetical protein